MTALEAAIAAGFTLPTIGGGVVFVWKKVDERFTAIETKLDTCEDREKHGAHREGVYVAVIEILLGFARRRSRVPSPEVARAEQLLGELKRD
jgi:hypothetical protein